MESWRRNLYILMVAQFMVMGAMTMIVPFLPLYLGEMGMTDPDQTQLWAGLIFGINFLSAFIMAPIWGTMADKYGRKIMVLRSGFGMGIVIFLTGLATAPIHLFLLRFLNGVISGFIPAATSLVAAITPKEKSGYALGLLQSGAVAGSITGPFIGGALAELIGFRMIFFVTSFFVILATVVVLFAIREEVKPNPKAKENKGLLEGASIVLKERPLLLLFSVGFILQFAMVGPMPQMSLYVSQLGAPGGYVAFFAGLVTAITGIANMTASPLLGRLGDRFSYQHVLFFAMLGAALFYIPHAFVTSIWQLLILRFLLGLCVGGLLPSLNALVRHKAPAGMLSTVFGYSTSATFLGNMLGPITGGFLSGMIGIRGLFITAGVLLIFGAMWLRYGLKISEAREEATP